MKENDKVLIAKLVLKITFIMIFVSVGIKLLGFNLFDANLENSILNLLSYYLYINESFILIIFINFLIMFLQTFIIFKLICYNTGTTIYIITTFIVLLINFLIQYMIYKLFLDNALLFSSIIYYILSFILLLISAFFIDSHVHFPKNINTKYVTLKKGAVIITVTLLYQFLVSFLRNISINDSYKIVYQYLLNLDYLILLFLSYYLRIKKHFKFKGDNFFEFKSINFLTSKLSKHEFTQILSKIKCNFNDYCKKSKFDRIVIVLYILFFIIQESLNFALVIFIASLNSYVVECIFIITAFVISKSVFGAFHFKSFIICFIISNITFFVLSGLTMKIEYTFVIPIVFGIMLSYIASRFIKSANVAPYRGMPKDDLDKLCENKKLNKTEVGVLTDFYCNRYNVEKLAIKYSYSDRSIHRIKSSALEKILV